MKMDNLKLRSFPEGSEGNTDFQILISNWLASLWQLEEGIAPTLTNAYRLGPSRRPPNSLPRDILIRCPDARIKQKILASTRPNGHLMFLDHKIFILQDLSAETLEARRRLKPLTTLLMKHKVRHRWLSYTKVQVIFKGVPLTAKDFGSANQMLQHIGITVPDYFLSDEAPKDQEHWQTA